MEHEDLTRRIIGCAMEVHRALGTGFLESVYQNALSWELGASGMTVEREKWIAVRYRGVVVGAFSADILVEDRIIVETKVARALTAAHEAQLVNYLTATGMDVGLLLNFGAERLQFRRKHRLYRGPVS